MSDQKTAKKIQITLTGRAPVRISPAEWPAIADARWHSGVEECQAGEIEYIRVRQHHADGRTLVYGERDSGPGGMPVTYEGRAGGFLLPATGGAPSSTVIAATIRLVGAEIGANQSTVANCIADLPAEDI